MKIQLHVTEPAISIGKGRGGGEEGGEGREEGKVENGVRWRGDKVEKAQGCGHLHVLLSCLDRW